MSRKRYSAEQIITKLREAEILSSRGMKVGEICRQIGVTENTYYRWRKEYGGLEIDQAKKFKVLEKENARLKKLVCVFRSKSATDSGRSRPPIPEQAGHPIRMNPATWWQARKSRATSDRESGAG